MRQPEFRICGSHSKEQCETAFHLTEPTEEDRKRSEPPPEVWECPDSLRRGEDAKRFAAAVIQLRKSEGRDLNGSLSRHEPRAAGFPRGELGRSLLAFTNASCLDVSS
jgi:hypothetical protein